jgi:DNA polymerase III delta prime subunit
MNTSVLPAAQLIVGPLEHSRDYIINAIQKLVCNNQGCATCSLCMTIKQNQYHNMCWLQPDKNYTLEDIDPVISTISLALPSGSLYFFVFDKADYLTPACANRLLKSIEEPPAGYHFIFLVERRDSVLPTIRSRCLVHILPAHSQASLTHPLARFFTHSISSNPFEFLKELDACKITEQESLELLDELLSYWLTYYKKMKLTNQNKDIEKTTVSITLLKQALEQPLMPGSSKLFWKNLFMAFHP